MKLDYTIKIICPHCGAEYLPAEIFYPESILGNPSNIIKDEDGLIEHYEGEEPDFTEEYTCDKCGHTFTVTGDVVYTVTEKLDEFDEDWSTTVFKGRIPLEDK